MSNNPIDSIVTPYKQSTQYGKVVKALSNGRYIVQLDSGVSINVSAESQQKLNAYVMVVEGRIVGSYKNPGSSKAIAV